MMGTYQECRLVQIGGRINKIHIRDYFGTEQWMDIMGTDRGWRILKIGGQW